MYILTTLRTGGRGGGDKSDVGETECDSVLNYIKKKKLRESCKIRTKTSTHSDASLTLRNYNSQIAIMLPFSSPLSFSSYI